MKLMRSTLMLARNCCKRVTPAAAVRNYSRGGMSKFPDPPCIKLDPNCHFVVDNCRVARDTLALKLPYEGQRMANDGVEPKCCVLRIAHQNPCHGHTKKKKVKPKISCPFRSMWEPPYWPDELRRCKDLFPRFDAIYYKPSDKWRCYQRTWVECPPKRLRLKKICCLDGIEPPEVVKRIKERCPKTACPMAYSNMRKICRADRDLDPNGTCTKLYWPCCKPARCPPKCHAAKMAHCAHRLRTPYRCFSDVRKKKRPQRYKECNCYEQGNMCDLYTMMRKVNTLQRRDCKC